MERIVMNGMEVALTIVLIYAVLKYWKWKLQGGYGVELKNRTYGVFLIGQIMTVALMVFSSVDPHSSGYLEDLSLFGEGALDYWTITGVQLFGIALLFMLANVLGHLVFNIALKEQDGLHEAIRNDNISAALVASGIILVIGYFSSHFMLRPYLFDWISNNAGLMPIR